MSDATSQAVQNNYGQTMYRQFIEGSFKVSQLANQVYWQNWSEFITSPHTLLKRNIDFWQEISTPPKPAWQTSYKEVSLPQKFSRIIKLLDFTSPATVAASIPTIILPPQAGHHSYIADYSPEQSQVQTLRQNGLSSIYCIEWLEATQATRHTTIEDYMEAMHYCILQLGGRANVVGDCQGGWLAAIYAALYPETVNSLVVAGAPIDFQAGNGQIKESINYLANNFPDGGMDFFRNLVKLGNGVLDGRWLVMGFNMMRPAQLPERYLNLYQNIHDRAALERFRQMKNWYDFPQNIAGDFYLWLVQHLFRDNELVTGRLVVGGQLADLGRITCPVFMMAGTRDHVTPPEQVFALTGLVSTPPEQVEQHLVEAGHIGLFMGREVLNSSWADLGQKLARLSELTARTI